jgi:hypothetical protein
VASDGIATAMVSCRANDRSLGAADLPLGDKMELLAGLAVGIAIVGAFFVFGLGFCDHPLVLSVLVMTAAMGYVFMFMVLFIVNRENGSLDMRSVLVAVVLQIALVAASAKAGQRVGRSRRN